MLVAVWIAYSPALKAGLVWDDHALVAEDAPWMKARIREIMQKPYWPTSPLADVRTTYYRPLVLVSFRVDVLLGGTGTEFHFTNLLVHVAACALLAFVAARAGASGGAAVLGALAWGVAPRLTESVAWISGRTDVFAGALVLGAIALSPDTERIPRRNGVRAWMRTIASAASLFAALLSKEVAVAGAIVIVACAMWKREGERHVPRDRLVRTAVAVGIPIVAYSMLRLNALSGVTEHHRELGPLVRTETVLESIGRYATMIVDAFHPTTSIGMIGEPSLVHVVLGALVVVALGAGIARMRGRIPHGIVVGGTLAVASLAPVIHVVPFNMSSATAADRLLYLPLAGVVIACASAASERSLRARWVMSAAACAFAFASSIMTAARCRDYADEPLFWVVAAENAHAHNTMSRNALAAVVRDGGAPELACRLFEASRAIQHASKQAGTSPYRRTRENLAGCWALIGRYDDATAEYLSLVKEFPDSGRIWLELAFELVHVRDLDGAGDALAKARTLDPSVERYARRLERTIAEVRADMAVLATEEARAAHPALLAELYLLLGRAPDADRACLAVAVDDKRTRRERRAAVRSLISSGDIEIARTAVAAAATIIDPSDHDEFRVRERRYARIAQLFPRIEPLARGIEK
jgi:tetratricopeptide (TPR) repeat protein